MVAAGIIDPAKVVRCGLKMPLLWQLWFWRRNHLQQMKTSCDYLTTEINK